MRRVHPLTDAQSPGVIHSLRETPGKLDCLSANEVTGHVLGKALTELRRIKRTYKLAISPSCQCRCVGHHRICITRGRPMILSSKLHYAIALTYLRDAAKVNLRQCQSKSA